MRRPDPIGSWSLAAAGLTMLAAEVVQPTLLLALQAGETAAWLSAAAAGLMAAPAYWVAARAVAALPGGDLISLARAAAGVPGAVATALAVAGVLVFHGGLVLRETAEMAVSSLYPHTPQTFALISLVLPVLYGALGGTAALVRLCRAFLPLLMLATLLSLAGAMGWGEARFLLPFWGPGPAALLGRSVAVTGLYKPVLFLLLAAGQVGDRRHLGRAGLIAIGAAALTIAAAEAVFTKAYPLPLGWSVTYPLHELSRLVSGGRFFERLEGIWLFIWVVGTGLHLAALLHAAAYAWAAAFGLPSHRLAVLPLVSVAVAVALFPPDQGQTLTLHTAIAPLAAAVGFGLPAALALLAPLRRRVSRGK